MHILTLSHATSEAAWVDLEVEFTKRKKVGFRKATINLSPQKSNPKKRQFQTGSPSVYKRPTQEQLELAITRDKQGFFYYTE